MLEMLPLRLQGLETFTLELGGRLPLACAQSIVPNSLKIDVQDGYMPVSLLIFRMQGLKPTGWPAPSLNYDEALWRVSVYDKDALVWLAHTCDLDRPFIRFTGRLLVRYPVRVAQFSLTQQDSFWRAQVDASSHVLACQAIADSERVAAAPARRVLVQDHGHLYEIPWAETPAAQRLKAKATVFRDTLTQATFGSPIVWDSHAVVHSGRIHHCGTAKRL